MKRAQAVVEIERGIELIKEHKCQKASEILNKENIKYAKKMQINQLISLLIPQKSKYAKEILSEIFLYRKKDFLRERTGGASILGEAVKYHRLDILSFLLEAVRERDFKNPAVAQDAVNALQYLLEHNQKDTAKLLMDKKVLKYISEIDVKEDIYRTILRYKDEELFRYIIAAERDIMPEIFYIPEEMSQAKYEQRILNQYAGQVNLEFDRTQLWEVALCVGAEKLISRMLRVKKDYEYLPRVAENTEEVFMTLKKIKPRNIPDELKEKVLLHAFLSPSGRERLEILKEAKWDRGMGKEKLSISKSAQEYLNGKKYARNKKGDLERMQDRTKLQYLIAAEKAEFS